MTTLNTTTEGQYVRLNLRGMHLALSKLIAIINAQPENTVLYINKDIKESGAWRYALAIDEAYRKKDQLPPFPGDFPALPEKYPLSFKPATFYGKLPLHEEKVGISIQTADEVVHRFVLHQCDAEQIGRLLPKQLEKRLQGMCTLSKPPIMLVLDEIQKHVEWMNKAYCPKRWPYDPELPAHHQMHPEFRAGAQNACKGMMRRLKKIEQGVCLPDQQKPHTAHSTHQSTPAHQCCTASHSHENPEGHEPADQQQDCMSQHAQKS